MKPGHTSYEVLMMEYAAGVLDDSLSMIVTSHILLSPQAARVVRECEAVGGALMENFCSPVAMNGESLQRVLERLDRPAPARPRPRPLPQPLQDIVSGKTCAITWKTVMPGVQVYAMPLPRTHMRMRARLMKLFPGISTPRRAHQGLELTLILEGALEDETGVYQRGDLLVADENIGHGQRACRSQGCVCVNQTAGPLQLPGLIGLLNSFFRY